jgi:hypothetical protein
MMLRACSDSQLVRIRRRLWRSERSPSELLQYMDVYGAPKALTAHSDLVALWTFDAGMGHYAHDASTNGNHLVMTRPELQSWTASTVAERKQQRAEQYSPPLPPSDSLHPHVRRHHPFRTFLLVVLFFSFGVCGTIAFIRRRELVSAAFNIGDVLKSRMRGDHGPAAYIPVDQVDNAFSDEVFSHYEPPSRLV